MESGSIFQLSQQPKPYLAVIPYQIGCPVVRKQIPMLDGILDQYGEMLDLVFLDSSPQDRLDDLIKEKEKFTPRFHFLIDDTQEIGRSLKVTRTGEIILIKAETREILFRGPISDQFGYGVDTLKEKKNYLAGALENLKNKKEIADRFVESIGCGITFLPDEKKAVYYGQVDRIVANKCLSCHFQKSINPTNFDTYDGLVGWSQMTKELILAERMPPWEVNTDFMKIHKDPQLTAQEKRVIFSWIRGGFAKGQERNRFVDKVKTQKPALKQKGRIPFGNTEELTIAKDSKTPWFYQKIELDSSQDHWIKAVQFKISNLAIMQHMALIISKEPLNISSGIFEPQFQEPQKLYNIFRLPLTERDTFSLPKINSKTDLALKVPKGFHLYLEAHFSPSGRDEKQSIKGSLLTIDPTAGTKELKYFPLSIPKEEIQIPAQAAAHVLKKEFTAPLDVTIFSLGCHMHWRGKACRFAVSRNGKELYSPFVSRYLMKNRLVWRIEKPLAIHKGDQISVQFEYNNSKTNPANIEFNKAVTWGPDPYSNEMATMHLSYY